MHLEGVIYSEESRAGTPPEQTAFEPRSRNAQDLPERRIRQTRGKPQRILAKAQRLTLTCSFPRTPETRDRLENRTGYRMLITQRTTRPQNAKRSLANRTGCSVPRKTPRHRVTRLTKTVSVTTDPKVLSCRKEIKNKGVVKNARTTTTQSLSTVF